MLLAIRDYIQQRQEVSLTELAAHFHVPAAVMQDRANQWVRKGIIAQKNSALACKSGCGTSSCSGCSQIDPSTFIVYIWTSPH